MASRYAAVGSTARCHRTAGGDPARRARRVTRYPVKDQIGVFHASLAQAFLGLIVFIGVVRSAAWRRRLLGNSTAGLSRVARIALLATLLIYGQMILGATMRHEHKDLSILDFPTAYQHWLPDTSPAALERINIWRDARGLSDVNAFQVWLQMAHRFGAVLVFGAILAAVNVYRRQDSTVPAIGRLLFVWTAGLFVQITLGAWTIWSNKAADIATAHVAVGAIMFALGVSITSLALRLSSPAADMRGAETTAGVAVLV